MTRCQTLKLAELVDIGNDGHEFDAASTQHRIIMVSL